MYVCEYNNVLFYIARVTRCICKPKVVKYYIHFWAHQWIFAIFLVCIIPYYIVRNLFAFAYIVILKYNVGLGRALGRGNDVGRGERALLQCTLPIIPLV